MCTHTYTRNHTKQNQQTMFKWRKIEKRWTGLMKGKSIQKMGKEQQQPTKNNLKSDLTDTPAKDMSLVTKNEW